MRQISCQKPRCRPESTPGRTESSFIPDIEAQETTKWDVAAETKCAKRHESVLAQACTIGLVEVAWVPAATDAINIESFMVEELRSQQGCH